MCFFNVSVSLGILVSSVCFPWWCPKYYYMVSLILRVFIWGICVILWIFFSGKYVVFIATNFSFKSSTSIFIHVCYVYLFLFYIFPLFLSIYRSCFGIWFYRLSTSSQKSSLFHFLLFSWCKDIYEVKFSVSIFYSHHTHSFRMGFVVYIIFNIFFLGCISIPTFLDFPPYL